MPGVRRSPVLVIAIVLTLLIGVALAVGGVWLIALGGSWYYSIAAVGFILTGLLLLAQRPAALWVYALVVAGTLGWALWEVGLHWWPLAARGDVVFLPVDLLTQFFSLDYSYTRVNYGYLVTIQPTGTDNARQEALARWSSLPKYLDTEVANLRETGSTTTPCDSARRPWSASPTWFCRLTLTCWRCSRSGTGCPPPRTIRSWTSAVISR